ncbi:hypothetical protein [Haloarcula argentinensis]|uniref:Preprotein translocase subunit TatA n=1 Tax=Haloarcula argentinensis TaxID=43776 RepID=A0A830FU27_HALAR|nr:hypothetical protein [Haloarcula argentinensis]EMA20886.1 hypothetical protein C443_13261 [Haloarcula argentinensis DSM 12282]MDS0254914.1 hypothetical protein [Haloarcula argentinensis]GGM38095.1 hypothetical protein GCM10009006_19070 [Haloarcula argentinensis]
MAFLQIPGLPGATELILMVIVLAVYIGLPAAGMILIYNFLDGKRGYEKRISELERQVETLESELSDE